MEACGLITEYNPFHQGHLYHLNTSREKSNADCMISVMSGNYLQRGEPAIIDKFSRTKAALNEGIDLVVELPFVYAVQHSDFFAKGAISTLAALKTSTVCFGSESGDINPFLESSRLLRDENSAHQFFLHMHLKEGNSFPEANRKAFVDIGLDQQEMDFSKPNNILGFSYVKEIMRAKSSIQPLTIKRIKNDYHDETVNGRISSATSIRKEILESNMLTENTKQALTESSIVSLENYKAIAGTWHKWESYFPFLQYKVATMTSKELFAIHGMEEGLEHRLKKTSKKAKSFIDWMERMKTKRYTWTRIQRLFVHLLTNTKKKDLDILLHGKLPYVRVLGMSPIGRAYLNQIKKDMDIPLFSQLQQNNDETAAIEERASEAYYSILNPVSRQILIQQEYDPPIMIN